MFNAIKYAAPAKGVMPDGSIADVNAVATTAQAARITYRRVMHDALRDTNGDATAHTYADVYSVDMLVSRGVEMLAALLPRKRYYVGARIAFTSGGIVSNAYRYSRNVTRITLEWRALGVYIVALSSGTMYASGEKPRVYLTPKQDAVAVAKLRTRYAVALD